MPAIGSRRHGPSLIRAGCTVAAATVAAFALAVVLPTIAIAVVVAVSIVAIIEAARPRTFAAQVQQLLRPILSGLLIGLVAYFVLVLVR